MITYLCIIVPFLEYIKPDWNSNGYLFTDGKGDSWDTAKQSKIMSRESLSRIGFRITTAKWRQIQVALDREFVRTKRKDEDAHEDSEMDGEDDIHEGQAGHTPKVGRNHYGLKGQRLNTNSVNLFREVSDKWHRWIGLRSRPEREWFEGDGDIEQTMNRGSTTEEDIRTALERIHGPQAEWRSEEQKQCTRSIVEGKSPLVCILPTGEGKTTLILVPALLSKGKTTVVVTPYVALADSLIEKCKKAKIDCMRWTKPTVERRTIVVVVSDTCTSQEFLCYVRDLFLRECLASVYFDEAHTFRTEAHFRHKFEMFRRLALAVPWIFLTATLPPSMETEFEKSLAMTNPRPQYIRAATNRSKTLYSVIRARDGNLVKELTERLNQMAEDLVEGEKVLVFCRSVTMVKRIAENIRCCSYYAKQSMKSDSLKAWERGEEKIMIATSALGAGLDMKSVMGVFHIERPYGCIQFVQESGRAGRDGETVKSTLILEEQEYQRLLNINEAMFSEDNRVMREFLIAKDCRRRCLSRYLDGEDKEIDCEILNGARCDNCKALGLGSQGQKRKHQRQLEEEARKRMRTLYERREKEVQENNEAEAMLIHSIEEKVQELSGKCTICWSKGLYEEYEGHSVEDCEFVKVFGIGSMRMKFAPNSCCFNCCLPADMCKFYGDHRCCKSARLIKHWVEVKLGEEDISILRTIEEISGRTFEMNVAGRKELWAWLGKERRVLEHNATNLFAVFSEAFKKQSF
jgi:superfamily II DNA helicase RecQ